VGTAGRALLLERIEIATSRRLGNPQFLGDLLDRGKTADADHVEKPAPSVMILHDLAHFATGIVHDKDHIATQYRRNNRF
jgi:hypothetical protein